MSGPVDVLAVMDAYVDDRLMVYNVAAKSETPEHLVQKFHARLHAATQARAAIAELIEALKDARAALDNVGLIDTYIDFDAVQAASDRADAALAAVSPK